MGRYWFVVAGAPRLGNAVSLDERCTHLDAMADAIAFAIANAPAEDQRDEWPQALDSLMNEVRYLLPRLAQEDTIDAYVADKADLPWLFIAAPSSLAHAAVARYGETSYGSPRYALHALCRPSRRLGGRYGHVMPSIIGHMLRFEEYQGGNKCPKCIALVAELEAKAATG
jgi:hypothetical protein